MTYIVHLTAFGSIQLRTESDIVSTMQGHYYEHQRLCYAKRDDFRLWVPTVSSSRVLHLADSCIWFCHLISCSPRLLGVSLLVISLLSNLCIQKENNLFRNVRTNSAI